MDTVNLLLKLGYQPGGDSPLDAATLGGGISQPGYRALIQWLTEEIRRYGALDDESVSSVDGEVCFRWELSSFLKELGCPYGALMDVPLTERFREAGDARMLVEYLVGECAALAMVRRQRDQEERRFQVSVLEPCTERDLLNICRALGLSVENLRADNIFNEINQRLNDEPLVGGLLFRPEVNLTADQWVRLERTQAELLAEYSLRQQMMLKRVDLTMAAFQWKGKDGPAVAQTYRKWRRHLVDLVESFSTADISTLLAADEELLRQERVSSTRLKGTGKNAFQGYLTLPTGGGVVNIDEKPSMPNWSSREEGQESENLRRKPKKPVEGDGEVKDTNKTKKKNFKNCDVISGLKE
uniref:Protein FAM98B n=1 Tax=Culex pipiens TaxID=7175 RepID=A0A8D8F7X9_CULPI